MTALDGVRVIELTNVITGPLCGQMLGDLGADVIKVENPDGGDMFRSWRGGSYSAHFGAYNRNKRSLTLNLRSDARQGYILRIVEQYCGRAAREFPPRCDGAAGARARRVARAHPKLIYCSITGFGHSARTATGRPTMRSRNRWPASPACSSIPRYSQITGPTIADNMTGINACYAIIAALFERERTGAARRIDVNMLELAITFMPDPWANTLQGKIAQGPLARVKASQSYALKCADGKLLALRFAPRKFWQGVQNAFERPESGKDPRFSTRAARIENYLALKAEFQKTAVTRPQAHWMARLERKDVPFAPVLTLPEVIEDPQVKHLDTFVEMRHPTEGAMTLLRRPVWFDGRRDDQPLKPPPTLGEHSAEALRGLGFDAKAVAALKSEGVI